jgi:2-(1,2-epoxy-1,2-dihydrophenyl)acetyl-CoA isomerase
VTDLQETYGDVTVALPDEGHVATVTIHRPPDNFFDIELIASIASAYEQLDADPRCRAIVLGSEGKHFCAGAALHRRSSDTPMPGVAGQGRHLYDEAVRLFSCKTPVVAAVRGAAVGGGLGLALSADFRVGASTTRMTANFARLGFHHGFGLTATLPPIVGQQRALEMLYTGVRLNGEDSYRIGLLDRLVEPDEIDAAAADFAAEIATSAPLAVLSIRETMRGDLPAKIRAATDREKAEQDRLNGTADFAEGVKATAERRTPNFQGR